MQENIRNFCIIAHIDHGKSTLADRLLEMTGAVEKREMQSQLLDNMDIERERGITIKLQTVRINYKAKDGKEYVLNLIDTPGHVDFSYEVSRSLAACEGALLVVDAAQGIEAQTLANVYLALEHDLEIIPVINKIDLPSAQPDVVKDEIEEVIGLDASDAILCSAKTGEGIEEILEAIVQRIPAPEGDAKAPLQALIFDSYYDSYRGAIAYIRVIQGTLRDNMTIHMMHNDRSFEVTELGVHTPKEKKVKALSAGEVGYVAASMKQVSDTRVGDTITDAARPAPEALPGYKRAVPMVFCGLYPVDNEQYPDLKDSLAKLSLNDASLEFEPETSQALGFGFRCGFLGMLHMEIIQERLEREYNLTLITTAPSVIYHVYQTNNTMVEVDNPSQLPAPQRIDHIEEHLRHSAGGDRLRLFRSAEDPHQGLRVDGLRDERLPQEQPCQARHPCQRRAGRRPLLHCAQRQGLLSRTRPRGEAAQPDPAPDVRGADPGSHRQQGHCPRNRQGAA